ncbi:dTDP-4-dehydrorhamnose reductase [Lachnospiraceae bacterium C7]|nr:dTDP-4-dehydrorhamnose reductase [Lachnospiraceae bacterium C7]
MKILVTGVCGQLGHDVVNELSKRNETESKNFVCIGSDITPQYNGVADGSAVTKAAYVSLDITDAAAVEKAIIDNDVDAVIHCAAWTAVDLAEDDDKKEKVKMVNTVGTQNLVNAVKKLDAQKATGCKFMYISTDYVFDGQGTTPWNPDCKDYAPLNVYGQTKLGGELAVSENLEKYFIVRIAWVFGRNGKNFIKTMLRVGKSHDKLTVVCDQIGTPTYTYDLAVLLCDMVETEKYGYYHATNAEVTKAGTAATSEESAALIADADAKTAEGCKAGYISWYDFTKEIFRQAVLAGHAEYSEDNISVKPVTTEEYGVSKAARPFNSRLDKSKLVENGFAPLPSWQDAVKRYIAELDFDALD